MGQFYRFKGCISKKLFETEDMAEKARVMNEKQFGRPMKVYKCKFCTGYHLAKEKK